MIDHVKFQSLVRQLYSTVHELQAMFPGRHFTPDGHMVGSLGECLVADAYALTLQTASSKGYDAVTANGVQVEINAKLAHSSALPVEDKQSAVYVAPVHLCLPAAIDHCSAFRIALIAIDH